MQETLVVDPKEGNVLTKYSREEVLEATLDYFNDDSLAAEVWINKYCLKDSEGNLYEKTPDDMHWRLANELARIEKKYPNPLSALEIYNKIKYFNKIVPQGSPMSGIGNDFQTVSISNCFVIGNEKDADSYGGIFKLDQEIAQLQKRRAGVGVDVAFIRPKGSPVKNSALTSTGTVPFMERFSNTTREVAQDGRRGALMISTSIKHPDSEEFIDAKMSQGKVTGANVSVRIDDDFMEAATQGSTYTQQYPVEATVPKVTKEINASKLWKKIVHNAWDSAEPGILFWDTIIRESIPDCYADEGFKTISTNPCGEITLCANDSCRLLAINLYGYVVNPFTDEAYFDWDEFKKDIIIAERLMDDIVDLELEKIDKILEKLISDPEEAHIKKGEIDLWTNIRDKADRGRRTGLGITAEGDMLAALGYKYGSKEGNEFSVEVHKQLKLEAYRSSIIMAKERGAFPMYNAEKEKNNPFILRIKDEDPKLYNLMVKYGRRNLALLTIAPTGTVSLMTQTTSGVEPVFLISYKRRRKINPNDKDVRVDFTDEVGDTWMEYAVFHHKFIDWYMANSDEEFTRKEAETFLSHLDDNKVEELIKTSPYYGATSNDVDWVMKVKMQGAIQAHVDHSISVTVNLPNEVTEEMVGQVYEMGWKSGCFKEGNDIYTKYGIKDISQITVGDEVYGHDGKLHIVDEIYDLPEETRKFVRFKLNGYQSIESTSEHPFLVIELDESENKKSWDERTKNLVWKIADEIKLNDHLVVPNNFENNNNYIDRLDLTNSLNCNYLIEKDEIFLSRILPWKENKMVKSANSKPIPRYVDIDEDLSYFIGWFIAEGHFSSESYVRFTLNLETELGVANKLITIGKEKFNLDGYKEIKHSNGGVSLTVQFGSRLLSNIMRSFCGQYSDNKHLPEWFMKIKPELLKIMIDCHYDGDKGITISDRLNREILMARNILNERIFASDNYGQGYEVKLNDSSVQSSGKLFKNYYAYRVFEKQISYSNEKVYNFSVEDVDSYIVNGISVHNCKGITVYRDGSRSGVLISDTEKKKKKKDKLFKDHHAPKRPKRLKGEIVRFQNNHEKWIGVVGMLDGRPYEVFTGLHENGLSNLPTNLDECEIVKNKDEEGKKRYDIEYTDSNGEKQCHTGLNHKFNPEYWNYAKTFSAVLRHGMPIPYVINLIQSLNLNDEHLNTWKNGVVRLLKRFVRDGEKANGSCPQCGSENLEYKEGCLTCMSCGNSKCG